MKKLEDLSNFKIIIVLTVILLFFILYLFPSYSSKLNDIAKQEVKVLDVRFSYSKFDVEQVFTLMKEEGRENYKIVVGFIDMIYPIVYGFIILFLLIELNRGNSNRKLKLIYIFPIIVVVLDYIENINILLMLKSYPNIADVNVILCSTATSLKWTFVLVSFTLIILLLIIKLVRNKTSC